MALAPGTRLGPYEVTAQIGVGGMGEGYRATDANLGRQVAIKVLPQAFAQDAEPPRAERLASFQRSGAGHPTRGSRRCAREFQSSRSTHGGLLPCLNEGAGPGGA